MKYIFFLLLAFFSFECLISQEENQHFTFDGQVIPVINGIKFQKHDLYWSLIILKDSQNISYKEALKADSIVVEEGLSESSVKYYNDLGDIFYVLELKHIKEPRLVCGNMIDSIVGFDILTDNYTINIDKTTLKIGESIKPFIRKMKMVQANTLTSDSIHLLIDPIVFEDKSCYGQILTIYFNDQKKITRFYLQDNDEYSEELLLQ